MPPHPSRSDDHERKMLSVYAAALHCGLCRGLPRCVCRDGARGWYSIFCRRWYLRLVCTKVDADEKEVSRRDGKEGLKRKAASPAGQLLFCMGGEPCQQELNTYDKENEGRSPGNISERGSCQWQGTAAEESVPCHAERSSCFAVG